MKAPGVEAIANAVLYEGYALYPYRASAVKNRRRFNFGLVVPRDFRTRIDQGYSAEIRTECLVEGGERTSVAAAIRFLQLSPQQDPAGEPSAREPWLVASEQAIPLPRMRLADLAARNEPLPTTFAADRLTGCAELHARRVDPGGFRVVLRVVNTTPFAPVEPVGHNDIVPFAFVATHAILSADEGAFVSLLEPPGAWREAAAQCANEGVWPVLAGDRDRRTVLASPIILYDYPEVASESPGDLFDGAEIDEILTLRILTLTDDEKDEIRRTDERTRRLLERTEQLTPEHLMKLHGAMRGRDAGGGG